MSTVEQAVERALEVLARRPSALATDIDGTLSRIVPNPQDAVVDIEIKESLRRLIPLLDVVAVVTARENSVARRMVGVEGLQYVGSYSLESPALAPPGAASVSAAHEGVLPLLGRLPCVTLELKDVSFALHYRNCEDRPGVRARLLSVLEPLVADSQAKLVEGKQVIEVVPRDLPHKGEAFRRLIISREVRGAVFMGDDLGDVPIFKEIARRRDEEGMPGVAIAVADEESAPEVLQSADLSLSSVDEVAAFLEEMALRLAGRAKS